MSYYAQWKSHEVSLSGEFDDGEKEEDIEDKDEDAIIEEFCPRCSNGCNYCLMLSY